MKGKRHAPGGPLVTVPTNKALAGALCLLLAALSSFAQANPITLYPELRAARSEQHRLDAQQTFQLKREQRDHRQRLKPLRPLQQRELNLRLERRQFKQRLLQQRQTREIGAIQRPRRIEPSRARRESLRAHNARVDQRQQQLRFKMERNGSPYRR